jgi:hypothetical protein
MIYLAPSKLNLKPSEITRDINIDEIPMYWYNIFTTNCYAYALGLDVDESSIAECAYQPGVMGSVIFNYPLINLKNMSTEEKIFLDMEALKIRIKEANPSDNGDYRIFHKKDNETVSSISFSWIISLYENENDLNDFHFARKTDTGIWYHKEGRFVVQLHGQPHWPGKRCREGNASRQSGTVRRDCRQDFQGNVFYAGLRD